MQSASDGANIIEQEETHEMETQRLGSQSRGEDDVEESARQEEWQSDPSRCSPLNPKYPQLKDLLIIQKNCHLYEY